MNPELQAILAELRRQNSILRGIRANTSIIGLMMMGAVALVVLAVVLPFLAG